MMAMLQCCWLVFVLVGYQIHHAESAVTFPTEPVVVSISKNPAVNSAVVTVTATDGTDGTTLAYTLESQDPDSSPKVFSIDGTSGEITVSDVTQLEYPTKKLYTLKIKAAQSMETPETGTTTVTVNLVNKEPSFAQALYTVCVNKDLSAGTSILQVTASDEDGDTLAYSITAGNTNSMFAVEASDGTIKVADGKTIDETQAPYSLTITATDNDRTTASGTTEVSISVADPCPATTLAPVTTPAPITTPAPVTTPPTGDTPAPNFATTMTASFCLFLISVSVHLLHIW